MRPHVLPKPKPRFHPTLAWSAAQAKEAAAAASAALTEAASTAMAAVEDLVQQCVKARDYSKLRPLAQTSVLAGQVPYPCRTF